MIRLYWLYLAISAQLLHQLVATEPSRNSDLDEEQWDYEPRTWSVDEQDNELEGEEFPIESFEEEPNHVVTDHTSSPVNSQSNPHKQHYYLGSTNFTLNKLQSNQEDECTQFRVDTREAVVCDKYRCDKLDFEWPKYDNQLTIIETTKHGMRFHRADYAFASNSQSKRAADNHLSDYARIKLDIFDLFKPKPSSTVTAPAATTQSVSPSNTPSVTTTPSTSSTSNPSNNIRSQDSNNTQLITTLRLNTKRTKQKILGFGGALSDSTCRNIKSLSPAMAKSLMEDYYGDRGLRYTIARMTIGSSDFSTTPYTNNDRAERTRQSLDEKDDVEMNNFRLTEEDYEFKLPVARQAIAISKQPINFFASLWSPPIWMKNNSHIVHGYLKGDVYGPYYRALAELMVKWLEAYKKNGLEFWGITSLNEPVTGVKPFIFHNSIGITREDYVLFYKLYLGPTLWRRGFQNVKLMMLDDNKGYAPLWVKAMLEDKEAAKYISGIATHWYMNDEYENLNFITKQYPDKFILPSEACNGFLPFQVHALPGNWDRGVAYMYDIIKLLQKKCCRLGRLEYGLRFNGWTVLDQKPVGRGSDCECKQR